MVTGIAPANNIDLSDITGPEFYDGFGAFTRQKYVTFMNYYHAQFRHESPPSTRAFLSAHCNQSVIFDPAAAALQERRSDLGLPGGANPSSDPHRQPLPRPGVHLRFPALSQVSGGASRLRQRCADVGEDGGCER